MSLVCVASAHGSPGVTTVALSLAATWPGDGEVVLVEADPFGGVLAARSGLADTPGLVSLAAEARGGLNTTVIWRHAQALAGGLPVLVGPPSAEQATAVLRDITAPLAAWSASTEVAVIVDCGRQWSNGSLSHGLLTGADDLLLVCRPSADQLRPAVARLRSLGEAGISGRLLLIGDAPYGPSEVESAVEVPVAGVVAFDPAAAAALPGEGGSNAIRRSRLIRSVASLADHLAIRHMGSPVAAEASS